MASYENALDVLDEGTAHAARRVYDAERESTWRVYESPPPPHLAARCTRCLIFDAGDVVRRICGQGPEWQELSDAALLALMHAP